MSTSNFTKINASNYYVIEDNECRELNDLAFELTEQVKSQGIECTYLNEWHEWLKCYEILKMKDKITGPCYFSADMDMILTYRAGYYQDGTLDYDFGCRGYYDCFWLSDYESAEDMAEDMMNDYIDYCRDYQYVNSGLLKIHAERLKKSILEQIEIMMERMDDMCADLCDKKLRCVGHFSNGGAVYQPIA